MHLRMRSLQFNMVLFPAAKGKAVDSHCSGQILRVCPQFRFLARYSVNPVRGNANDSIRQLWLAARLHFPSHSHPHTTSSSHRPLIISRFRYPLSLVISVEPPITRMLPSPLLSLSLLWDQIYSVRTVCYGVQLCCGFSLVISQFRTVTLDIDSCPSCPLRKPIR